MLELEIVDEGLSSWEDAGVGAKKDGCGVLSISEDGSEK